MCCKNYVSKFWNNAYTTVTYQHVPPLFVCKSSTKTRFDVRSGEALNTPSPIIHASDRSWQRFLTTPSTLSSENPLFLLRSMNRASIPHSVIGRVDTSNECKYVIIYSSKIRIVFKIAILKKSVHIEHQSQNNTFENKCRRWWIYK